ncbi:hypothetical protein V491_07847 [Pseudogymnoascus sp. VKM F-3775]|nr:hypothetical protein V491_07847 [Pseudogymnoascus sp. VKM F-3775]
MAGFPNLAQLMGDDIVTVYVGPREKRYSIHKALLTSQSEYFEKALNGKFREADEQTIRLPEDSPDAFDLLIGWLYQNQIPVLGYGPGPFDEFPRGIVVGATKLGNTALPPNHGTGTVAYLPHEEPSTTLFQQTAGDNNLRDRFNHICTQSEYTQYSADELRLEDYTLNHRFSDFSRPSPENIFIPDPFPVSSGHIDGIPYCSPIKPIMESEEAHQLALIRLCLFAETICWTNLFNIAMSTYMQGESFLAPRPMPAEHIELIYERAHPESPCRKFAADSTISQINAAGQIDKNMDLVEQWPTFLEDIFKRLRLSQGLPHTHGPMARGPCEYHVHDTKHQPENCSAASETPRFILDVRAPTKQTFITKLQYSGHSSGVDSENTRSRDSDATAGSSGEIRYTTYVPNTGYTTRTLGYDSTSGPPYEIFGRPSDNMDWGSGYRPWLNGGGFGQAPTSAFGTSGFVGTGVFGSTAPPFSSPGTAPAPTSTNAGTTAVSSSSTPNNGSGSPASNNLSPQAAPTAPPPASPGHPQAQPTIPATSPNTSASTASPAVTTSVGGPAEAGTANATLQKDTSGVSGSTTQGANPTFGKVSPLASPLSSLTAKSIRGDHIFGQTASSNSSTPNTGSFFPSPEPAARTNIPTGSGFAGITPPSSSSTSGTDAGRAAPPNTNAASTSPFGLLGARSSPASISYSLFGSAPRASDASTSSTSPPSNAASTAAPHSAGSLFGSLQGASDASAPSRSPPSNLFGSRTDSNISPSNAASTAAQSNVRTLFGSVSTTSSANAPAISSSLFGSISTTSSTNVPATSSSNLFGFANASNVSPSNAAATAAPSNARSLFGSTSGTNSANVTGKPSTSHQTRMPHSVTPDLQPIGAAANETMGETMDIQRVEPSVLTKEDEEMGDIDDEEPTPVKTADDDDTAEPTPAQGDIKPDPSPVKVKQEINLENIFDDMSSDEEFPSSAAPEIKPSPSPQDAPSPINIGPTARASDPEVMRSFYQRLFPWRPLFQWLNHSPMPSNDFAHREFAFTLSNDAYLRYQSFPNSELLRRDVLRLMPSRFEIGPVYSTNPRDRKTLRGSTAFKPIAKELCFDIDLTDYDDVRTCCDKANICNRCWQFITMAIKVVDVALRDDFGFKHIMWVYSGRRGAHAWVCDKKARTMDDSRRRAIAGYLEVIKGGAQSGKKVNVKRPLHPHLARSLETLKSHFQADILEDQDPWATQEKADRLLQLLPDRTLNDSLRKKWDSAPGRSSSSKWADIDALAKTGASKSLDTKALLEAKQDIVLEYTYPRLDIEVSKKLNHLLKSPFVVHPGTGRVCVPIDTRKLEAFDPLAVPTVTELLGEIDKWTGPEEVGGKHVQDWEKTSLKPYIDYFRTFVAGIVRDEKESEKEVKVKREREEGASAPEAMEF